MRASLESWRLALVWKTMVLSGGAGLCCLGPGEDCLQFWVTCEQLSEAAKLECTCSDDVLEENVVSKQPRQPGVVLVDVKRGSRKIPESCFSL